MTPRSCSTGDAWYTTRPEPLFHAKTGSVPIVLAKDNERIVAYSLAPGLHK